MRVIYMLLADSVVPDPSGKANMLGAGLDTILALSFPCTHPSLALFGRLEVALTECGHEHTLRVELLNPDGQIIGEPLAQVFTPERNLADPGRPSLMALIFQYIGLPFPAPGDYAFHILIDNNEMVVVPLYLKQQPG